MSVVVNANLITATFTGNNGIGAISVTGLEVGDKLIYLRSPTYLSDVNLSGSSVMEAYVTVADEIQQIVATDHSGHTFDAVFVRD